MNKEGQLTLRGALGFERACVTEVCLVKFERVGGGCFIQGQSLNNRENQNCVSRPGDVLISPFSLFLLFYLKSVVLFSNARTKEGNQRREWSLRGILKIETAEMSEF